MLYLEARRPGAVAEHHRPGKLPYLGELEFQEMPVCGGNAPGGIERHISSNPGPAVRMQDHGIESLVWVVASLQDQDLAPS